MTYIDSDAYRDALDVALDYAMRSGVVTYMTDRAHGPKVNVCPRHDTREIRGRHLQSPVHQVHRAARYAACDECAHQIAVERLSRRGRHEDVSPS